MTSDRRWTRSTGACFTDWSKESRTRRRLSSREIHNCFKMPREITVILSRGIQSSLSPRCFSIPMEFPPREYESRPINIPRRRAEQQLHFTFIGSAITRATSRYLPPRGYRSLKFFRVVAWNFSLGSVWNIITIKHSLIEKRRLGSRLWQLRWRRENSPPCLWYVTRFKLAHRFCHALTGKKKGGEGKRVKFSDRNRSVSRISDFRSSLWQLWRESKWENFLRARDTYAFQPLALTTDCGP